MPIIMFYGPVTRLSMDQKKELVKAFTDSAVKVTGIPAPEFTVLLRATAPDLVGIGGELLCDIHNKK